VEPLWLSVAGDAGSALGGLTVFGALIGYLLKERSENIEDRRELALHLDQLYRDMSLVRIGPLPAQNRHRFREFFQSRTRLDVVGRGKARNIARHIEGLLVGFDLKVETYAVDEEPEDLAVRWNALQMYILMFRHDLIATPKADPVKKHKDDIVNQWHFEQVARSLNEEDKIADVQANTAEGAG
jgi:hypothetical protein